MPSRIDYEQMKALLQHITTSIHEKGGAAFPFYKAPNVEDKNFHIYCFLLYDDGLIELNHQASRGDPHSGLIVLGVTADGYRTLEVMESNLWEKVKKIGFQTVKEIPMLAIKILSVV